MYYGSHIEPYQDDVYYRSGDINRSNEQIADALLTGIIGEATAVDFYYRLAQATTNETQRRSIHDALKKEQAHLQRFTDLYTEIKGNNPAYQIDRISFNTFEEGLDLAYEIQSRNYGAYRDRYEHPQLSPVQDLFLRACNDEAEIAERFNALSGHESRMPMQDYGGEPLVVDINLLTLENDNFRTALWTGEHFQVTLMSIEPGDDIGLEVHPNVDQFIRLEQGEGFVQMGDTKDQLTFEQKVMDDYAVMVPAGKWHNITNIGDVPMKVYVIYAPPEHPFGTVHETKKDAMEAEG
ncbi:MULTISPECIES: cupin domain-containing protein [Pontibacillus]|uniref:Cupin domain-containing protein n=1 Tax=Pontibacillus chungwhensis TaxID=265426 RepID=A0ABY8UUC1_9BACI|nr:MULTISPECIES: cupin domain-containing protein [Pontibacillus]MCD5323258.1 cupin domain-containing protein [Pontibacillus sp. HN14]WIF96642.1 cupin domain-containing protein [Pontibacillus chungwhensis]